MKRRGGYRYKSHKTVWLDSLARAASEILDYIYTNPIKRKETRK